MLQHCGIDKSVHLMVKAILTFCVQCTLNKSELTALVRILHPCCEYFTVCREFLYMHCPIDIMAQNSALILSYKVLAGQRKRDLIRNCTLWFFWTLQTCVYTRVRAKVHMWKRFIQTFDMEIFI